MYTIQSNRGSVAYPAVEYKDSAQVLDMLERWGARRSEIWGLFDDLKAGHTLTNEFGVSIWLIDPNARYTLTVPGRRAPFASMPGTALTRYLARHPEAASYVIRKVA